jgi:hypothetical protein
MTRFPIFRLGAGTCAALLACALLAACTPASRMVREPALQDGVAVGQTGSEAGLDVEVERVVAPNGPGAWVRGAAWDEYVVKLSARGEAPVHVLEVSLASEHLPDAAHPTADLEALEKRTSAQVHVLQTAGVTVALGYGAGAVAFASTAGGATQVGLIAGATAAAVMIPVAAIAGGVYMHKRHNRQKADRVLMQDEIARRALPMPLELEPGSAREGSWFFPITPAPTRLELRYEQDGAEQRLAIELPQLAELHLEAPAKPAEPQAHR